MAGTPSGGGPSPDQATAASPHQERLPLGTRPARVQGQGPEARPGRGEQLHHQALPVGPLHRQHGAGAQALGAQGPRPAGDRLGQVRVAPAPIPIDEGEGATLVLRLGLEQLRDARHSSLHGR